MKSEVARASLKYGTNYSMQSIFIFIYLYLSFLLDDIIDLILV